MLNLSKVYTPDRCNRLRYMLHVHDSPICIGEVDVGADLSRSTHFRV